MVQKQIQQDAREKQLNPNAPPFQPPLYGPYPYGMFDPMHMVFMNDMPMGMGGMPHHGVLYQPHRPPPTGKGRGMEMPPSNPGYFQPVVGPGFMPRPRVEQAAGTPAGPASSPVLENGSSPRQGQNGSHSQEAQQKLPKVSPRGESTPDPLVAKKGQVDGKEKDSPAGSDSPRRGGSSVITPWPSFPGAGVWHSDQRPLHNGQTPMMTNYNSYMPGPYPVWPGMPHYVPGHGQQEPVMWSNGGMRPMPMPNGSHPGMPGMPGMVGMPYMPMMWRGNFYPHPQQVRHKSGRYGNGGQGRGRSRHSGKDSRKNHRPTINPPGSTNHTAPTGQED